MRNLGILLLVCVIVAVGLGFYFQWFQIATDTNPDRSSIEVTVDREKIRKDVNQAKEEARELGRKANQKADSAVHDR